MASPNLSSVEPMLLRNALQVLVELRQDQIVVSSMGSAREWPRMSKHPLDFHYVPSAMGQAAILGLGLALAQPKREVIALSGDGSLLMNLGGLVTIVASGAKNLTLVVIENGVYEVTGGQKTAATASASRPDFVAIGRGCGFNTCQRFDTLSEWKAGAAVALEKPGPRLLILNVAPVTEDFTLEAPGPIGPRLAQFQAALQQT